MVESHQTAHEPISTALDVEKLEENLFRSKSLWHPPRTRGVFGGQVVSQALVSVTSCVNPVYGVNSIHCYFLSSASSGVPILYHVEPLRSGRSYSTFSVKAVQNGEVVFVMMCSFHKPEPWHPSSQWTMPKNVPEPEECELQEDLYHRLALEDTVIRQGLNKVYRDFANERARNPIAVKLAKVVRDAGDGRVTYMYWMRARDIPKYNTAYQKCILGYISDMYFISTGARISGLKRFGKGPEGLGMSSTLDHSIYYYDDNFDCAEWLLYVIVSPRVKSGRGVVHGQLYSRNGTLVAITSQEGVIRANIRGGGEAGEKGKL